MWSGALTRHDELASWEPMCRILYRFLVSLAGLAVRSGCSKDLEIIVLRHQLTVLHRLKNRPALAEEDRALLGAIAAALPRRRRAGWLVTPETLLRWHRRRIARHWTQPCRTPGRPCTSVELRCLIIEMATNNSTWGYRRITGELVGLGHRVGASTVWRILKQHRIDPAPQRTSVTWTQFLRSQAAVACDFITVDTALLRRYYLLFFIDITNREVFYGGITANPTGAWTTQAARNLFVRHPNRFTHTRALVRDRASQFTRRLRRDLPNRRPQDLAHPGSRPSGQRVRRTLDRHPSTRAPRPHHHLEPTATQKARRRLHRSLQHAPAPPFTRPATTRRHRPSRPARWAPPSR